MGNRITGLDLFLANIPSIVCLIIAGILICNNTKGWGWFLFFAVIFGNTIDSSEDDKK